MIAPRITCPSSEAKKAISLPICPGVTPACGSWAYISSETMAEGMTALMQIPFRLYSSDMLSVSRSTAAFDAA